MKDLFNDSAFDNFLYGGVSDLDEPVGPLVYTLYRAGIITTWSCSGHIDKFNEDAGGNALPGNYVYRIGQLDYRDDKNSQVLTNKLTEITQANSFASLVKRQNMEFSLEMQDIVVSCDIPGYAKKQVPIEKAQERYNQFLEIWEELTRWSKLKL